MNFLFPGKIFLCFKNWRWVWSQVAASCIIINIISNEILLLLFRSGSLLSLFKSVFFLSTTIWKSENPRVRDSESVRIPVCLHASNVSLCRTVHHRLHNVAISEPKGLKMVILFKLEHFKGTFIYSFATMNHTSIVVLTLATDRQTGKHTEIGLVLYLLSLLLSSLFPS